MKKTIEVDVSANSITKKLLGLGLASFGASMIKANSNGGFIGRTFKGAAILAATIGGMAGVNKFVDEVIPPEEEPEEVEVVKTEPVTETK